MGVVGIGVPLAWPRSRQTMTLMTRAAGPSHLLPAAAFQQQIINSTHPGNAPPARSVSYSAGLVPRWLSVRELDRLSSYKSIFVQGVCDCCRCRYHRMRTLAAVVSEEKGQGTLDLTRCIYCHEIRTGNALSTDMYALSTIPWVMVFNGQSGHDIYISGRQE